MNEQTKTNGEQPTHLNIKISFQFQRNHDPVMQLHTRFVCLNDLQEVNPSKAIFAMFK